MHLTDVDLAELAHGHAAPALREAAERHLARCATCRMRLDTVRQQDVETGQLLRLLDHAPPAIPVDALLLRARRHRPARTRRVGAVAAGIALCVAAAAAALPNSPVRRAIVRAVAAAWTPAADRGSDGAAQPVPNGAVQRAAAGAGIALVPGATLDVRLGAWQAHGTLRVVLVDSADASLVSMGGEAAFSIADGRIVVDAHGTSPSFTLTVPRTVRDVRVQIDTTVLFRKRAAEITSIAPADRDGAYTLDLTLPAHARPHSPR